MKSNLYKTTVMIAVITIFSKLVGFLRDVVIAKCYGTTLVSDAYFYAYQFPALAIILLGGLGGPFHTATVSVFSKLIPNIDEKPEVNVQRLFNTFVTLTGIVFLVFSLLFFFFAPQIIDFIAQAGSGQLKFLAIEHLRIMSPMIFIGGVIGIFYGISNVYKEFFYTSLSPTILSVVIIVALLLLPIDKSGLVLAYATLIGAIGQLLIQLPVFAKIGFSYYPKLFLNDDNLRNIGEILFPAMLGTTIGQINIYVDMFFTSGLEEGAWSAIGYANRVFQFPVGVLITAMLVPLFPMFSSFVGKQDFGSLRKYFHEGLNSLWFLAFPLTAFCLIFTQDIIAILFQRGAFDLNATLMVSEAMFYITLSMIPYMARDTLTRVFYAFNDSRTPFVVAFLSIAVKFITNYLFVKTMGIGGIMLSTTMVTIFNATLLAFLIRKKIGLNYLGFATPVVKIFFATIVMSVAAIIFNSIFVYLHPEHTIIFSVLKLTAITILCGIIYFLLSFKLKLSPALMIINKIKNR